jgi:hypothetical protein
MCVFWKVLLCFLLKNNFSKHIYYSLVIKCDKGAFQLDINASYVEFI